MVHRQACIARTGITGSGRNNGRHSRRRFHHPSNNAGQQDSHDALCGGLGTWFRGPAVFCHELGGPDHAEKNSIGCCGSCFRRSGGSTLFWALVLPTLRTLFLSFFDATGKKFIFIDNYRFAFSDPIMLEAFKNNLLWMIFGTSTCVILGIMISVLVDKSKFEKFIKALIFMPMAISFVGAGVIWKFMYAYKGEGINITEIGLLNAIVVALGGEAQAWLLVPFWNNFFLIAIMVWLQTGYAMVIISSAIKSIPEAIMEAARIDGADDITIFFRITIPSIMPTIITVTTTILIFSLKLFDIVRVMTGGNYGTNVIANEFYLRQFTYGNSGQASAIAIVLLVVITPVLAYNLREFRSRRTLK